MNNNNYSDVRLTGIMYSAIGVTNPKQPLLETLKFVITFKSRIDLEKGKQLLKTISDIFHNKCSDYDGYTDIWDLLPISERIKIIETNIETFKNQILESNVMDMSPDEINDKHIEDDETPIDNSPS